MSLVENHKVPYRTLKEVKRPCNQSGKSILPAGTVISGTVMLTATTDDWRMFAGSLPPSHSTSPLFSPSPCLSLSLSRSPTLAPSGCPVSCHHANATCLRSQRQPQPTLVRHYLRQTITSQRKGQCCCYCYSLGLVAVEHAMLLGLSVTATRQVMISQFPFFLTSHISISTGAGQDVNQLINCSIILPANFFSLQKRLSGMHTSLVMMSSVEYCC